jgi:hypothetical protein
MKSHRITTPFGPQSTAAEVVAGIDLTLRPGASALRLAPC